MNTRFLPSLALLFLAYTPSLFAQLKYIDPGAAIQMPDLYEPNFFCMNDLATQLGRHNGDSTYQTFNLATSDKYTQHKNGMALVGGRHFSGTTSKNDFRSGPIHAYMLPGSKTAHGYTIVYRDIFEDKEVLRQPVMERQEGGVRGELVKFIYRPWSKASTLVTIFKFYNGKGSDFLKFISFPADSLRSMEGKDLTVQLITAANRMVMLDTKATVEVEVEEGGSYLEQADMAPDCKSVAYIIKKPKQEESFAMVFNLTDKTSKKLFFKGEKQHQPEALFYTNENMLLLHNCAQNYPGSNDMFLIDPMNGKTKNKQRLVAEKNSTYFSPGGRFCVLYSGLTQSVEVWDLRKEKKLAVLNVPPPTRRGIKLDMETHSKWVAGDGVMGLDATSDLNLVTVFSTVKDMAEGRNGQVHTSTKGQFMEVYDLRPLYTVGKDALVE